MAKSLFFKLTHKLLLRIIFSLCCAFALQAATVNHHSLSMDLSGQWYQAPKHWHFDRLPPTHEHDAERSQLKPANKLALTVGRYVYQSEFAVVDLEPTVIDFKNSSVLGRFHHYVFDSQQILVAKAFGGI